MPYSSISSAPASWRRLATTAGGATKVPLTLAQINYVARVYDGLVGRGRSKTQAAAMAIGQFRREHTVSSGRWIKKHDDIEYGVTKRCNVQFDSPFDITKHYPEGEGEDEKWYLEGIAVIDKLDYQDDVVSPEAMRTAAGDLEKNTTVLYNHDNNQEVGTIVEYAFLGDSIFIKVLISKTRPDIWTKIQEGTLRKFSVRGRVLAFDIRYIAELNKAIRYIKAMTINEVSIVSVSAQADAEAFRWYVKCVEDPMPYYIEKAFRLQRGGDSPMARKAHDKKATAVPGFTIEKNEKGQQVISLLVPEGLEKSDVTPDLNLDDIEKVAKAAQVKLDEIITAAEEALKSTDETTKAWAGKVLEAAKALKDNKFVPEEEDSTKKGDKSEEEDESSAGAQEGQTIQIVLPGESKTEKKDEESTKGEGEKNTPNDDEVTINAEDLAKADFQSCVLSKMQGGMDMTKAARECKCEMTKAEEATSKDDTGVVKMLLEQLMKRDNVNTTLQTAVAEIAKTVGAQTAAINDLTAKVKTIPVRKGLDMTEDQIETERTKLQKELEDKEPLEQLRVILDRTIGTHIKTT